MFLNICSKACKDVFLVDVRNVKVKNKHKQKGNNHSRPIYFREMGSESVKVMDC
jgi:hypothetical protein